MDESHKLKNASGQISRFASQVAERSARRLALTGTPMPHSPLDIYAQYRAVDGGVFGYDHRRFKDRYTVTDEISVRKKGVTRVRSQNDLETRTRTVGYKNEDELQEKFHSIAFVVAANEVLDLPDTTSNYRRVRLSPRAARIHEELDQEFRADVEAGKVTNATNALTRLLRLQQITSGFAVTENQETQAEETVEVDRAKADALQDILEDLDPEENVVVFARFLHDLGVVHRVARGAGRESWELSGRQRQLSDWQRAGGVLAAQIQAGSTGIDMTQARYCIYYSLGYSLGDYLQSRARVHRPGQTRNVHYIHLIAAGTVDETVMGSLRSKENVIERIMRAMGPAARGAAMQQRQ
jgi:SNF2 family DNA or RNA helicase